MPGRDVGFWPGTPPRSVCVTITELAGWVMEQMSVRLRRKIGERATGLYEYLDRRPHGETWDSATGKLLHAWNRAYSPGDTEAFRRRLDWDDLNQDLVRAALSPRPASAEPPPASGLDTVASPYSRAGFRSRPGRADRTPACRSRVFRTRTRASFPGAVGAGLAGPRVKCSSSPRPLRPYRSQRRPSTPSTDN